MQLQDKHALVTGGASGFGLRLVETLSAQGVRVAVLDIDEAKLKVLSQKIPLVLGLVCDVGNFQQVEKAVAEVYKQLGSLDILVNNAGIMKNSLLVNLLAKDDSRHPLVLWQKVMDVNLNSVFYLTVNVVDRMVKARTKGVVVNISSISAQGNAGQSAYAASKAGIEALTKVWAKELGPLGIRCAAVAPGFADTQGTADAIEEKMLKKWVDQAPLRRLGTIDEVVDSILYIIKNDFFNGRVLSIDGGLVI